jgi:hypothetical protein
MALDITMNRIDPPRSPFSAGPDSAGKQRNLPILTSATSSESPQADPMDVTPPHSATMGPPMNSSPELDGSGLNNSNGVGDVTMGSNSTLGAAAAAASQQPKVVQTAFIHKLYKSVLRLGRKRRC